MEAEKGIPDLISTELINMFKQHSHDEPDTLNEDFEHIKPSSKLLKDVSSVVDYVFKTLLFIVDRYRVAGVAERGFIIYDTKRLVLNMFKPYFRISYWIRVAQNELDKLSSDYCFDNGVFIDSDGIYHSFLVYLEDFVVNLI